MAAAGAAARLAALLGLLLACHGAAAFAPPGPAARVPPLGGITLRACVGWGMGRAGLFGGAGGPAPQRAGRGPRAAMDGPPQLRRNTPLDNVRSRGAEGRSGFGYVSILVVPTGVGAAIGGFAGDALPVARTMASVCDVLITHPNVMNGAMLYWPTPNVLYVEGYALDKFGEGEWGLLPMDTGGHRIGLLLDKGIDQDLITRHLQVADAARATLGINVCEYLITDEPVGVGLTLTESGASSGGVKNEATLLRGARRLVEEGRCTAIAVVCRFPEDETEEDRERTKQYVEGAGVDPVGGAEAVISHLITRSLQVPCAHAPANDVSPVPDPSVSPKAAAEELGFTFLPCVLSYLHRAPTIIPDRSHPAASKALWKADVDSIVIPHSAADGGACRALGADSSALVVAVEENETVMKDTPRDLGIEHVKVRTYLEAIGLLAAHKIGINPAALTPSVRGVRNLEDREWGESLDGVTRPLA